MAGGRGSPGDGTAGQIEARRPEQVLAEAEAALGVGTPDCDLLGLFVVDTTPTIVARSTAISYWLGWTGSGATTPPARDLVHPDDLAAATDALAKAVDFPGYRVPIDVRLRAPGGR